MRANRVGRRMSRASRAVFVLIMALVATAIGAAVAHADITWEFGQPSQPVKKPGVIVTEEPVAPDSGVVELGPSQE